MGITLISYDTIENCILNTPKFHPQSDFSITGKVYEYLEKPGHGTVTIHVAGTNGKGSVCAYLNSVLQEAGYKTGMFTSPHLVSLRERIQCDGEMISEEDFVEVYHKLQDRLEQREKKIREESQGAQNETKEKNYVPVFYEILFFMAMLYFESRKVDVIILETGLGGRLDATNVADAPKTAVITEIGMDHMEYLGNTFESIAREKAGIINSRCSVVYSPNRQEAASVIEQKAKEMGVSCRRVEKPEEHKFSFADKKIDFSFFSRYYGYIPIRLNTCAAYQMENACLALTAIEEAGFKIPLQKLQAGMEKCRWAGRMEEVMSGVYLDGAHNEDGIAAFLASVKEDGCKGKRWLLFSAAADKEYTVMKDKLEAAALFDGICVAPMKNARTMTKKDLMDLFDVPGVWTAEDAVSGFKELLSRKEEEDFVYAAGSLYLVGEIEKEFFTGRDCLRENRYGFKEKQ